MQYILRSLFFSFTFMALALSSYANTSVWKVSKGENYFYIGGTIHVLREDDHPLPLQFEQAYQDADTLVFETDIDASEKASYEAQIVAAMQFTDSRKLSSEITRRNYKKLEKFLAKRKIPIIYFAKYQPWGVSLVITLMEYKRLGMIGEFGVDNYFNNKGKKDKKTIISLETFEEQLGFLKSLSSIDPNENIEYTLRDIKRMPRFIEEMKAAWRTGDIEKFTSMPMILEMKNDYPQIYKTLITNRNDNWMSKIPAFIENKDIEFVLVGTLHLNDKDGLLNQLKAQGFKVQPL